jgi:hypothetical protein
MFNKLRFIILLFLTFLAFNVNGQNEMSITSDTIYIYETEIVYDTIFVIDTIDLRETKHLESLDFIKRNPFAISALLIDTAKRNANLLLVSKNYSATIPINNIILNEHNKNFESMKKLNFLGVIFFATQSMLFAQSDFGISVGGGAWWSECNNSSLATKSYSTRSSVNLFFRQNLKNKFFIETRPGYNLLFSNQSYKLNFSNSSQPIYWNEIWELHTVVPYDPTKLPLKDDGVPLYTIGDEASNTNFHLIEIPLYLGYSFKNFSPFIGIMYSLKMYNSTKTEVIYDANQDLTSTKTDESEGLNTFQNNWGIAAGINYRLSEKWSVGVNYYYGLTYDYKYKVNLYDFKNESILITENYNWKRRSLEISLSYSFRKKDKQKSEADIVETDNF